MEQRFLEHKLGMEFEFTGITRQQVSYCLFKRFQNEVKTGVTQSGHTNFRIKDQRRRTWRIKYDGSIMAEKPGPDGTMAPAPEKFKVELITPPLRYTEDRALLFAIIEDIVRAGGIVNKSCGIHIHLDGKDYTAQAIKNFANIVTNRSDLFAMALQIDPDRRTHYCSDLAPSFLSEINSKASPSMKAVEEAWYRPYDAVEPRDRHYHHSRYHFLNLHCLFHANNTIELRCFNGSLDVDTINAYILFALGLNGLAMSMKYTWPKRVELDNPRYTMVHFLQRIGLKGAEYAKCRELLASHLPGDPNWRYAQ